MRSLLLVLAIVFISFTGSVQAADVLYGVGFSEPQAHYADVEMQIPASGDSTDFKMPVWIPGSYMVREFSRMVEAFSAADAQGNKLRWIKVTKNAWRVYHPGAAGVKIAYRVYCYELTVRNSFIDHDRALLNGPSVFMYTEKTRNSSCKVQIAPAPHWRKISTGLPQSGNDPFVRTASGYDQLIDCPILLGNHTVFGFSSNGIMHEVAMSGKADYDSTVIIKDFKAITEECTKIFGSNPLDRYVFIILNTPTGGGGLEHSNSTVLQVSADTYRDSSKYKGLLSLAAHEYFHLWLVKRIRDAKLGPFDYDNEVYTTQLWFYEGFTSFYDDYIVYRTGRFSEQEYLDVVKGNIGAVVNTPGINYQSLSESSFDAWIKFYRRHENSNNSTVSYYTKGGVVAAMMNLDLLSRTDGTKSLDDLMKKLYSRFLQKGSGVTDEELLQAFSDTWGTDMSGFFNRFIYGTEAFPFEEYVLKSGMKLIRTDGLQKKPGYLGATFSEKGGQLIITGVRRNSPAWVDGLNVNDEILKADTASQSSIKAYLELKEPGNEVLFTVKRFGEEKILMVTLGEDPSASFAFESLPKPTSLQRKVRKGWLK